MSTRVLVAAGVATVAALVVAGCGSASSSPPASPASSATTAPPAAATSASATPAGSAAGASCPTLAQAEAALGASYSGLTSLPAKGGGIICEYPGIGGAANAGVTIYAHQSPAVISGQIANLGSAPGMKKISGVGSGAFASDLGGRAIVNAYSAGSRTFVAAQASRSLAETEALARVALADN